MRVRAIAVATTLALTGGLIGSGLAQWLPPALDARAVQPLEPRLATETTAPSELSGGLFGPVAPVPAPHPTAPADTPCEIPWRLVGTMLDNDVPARSFAAVHTPGGARLIAISMTVSELEVVALAPGRATLERADGRRCELHMFSREEPSAAPAPPPLSTPVPAPAESAAGVRQISPDHIEVSRELFNPSGRFRGVRAVPELRDGRMVGARVFGVRRGSLLAAAGVQNGDSIRAVDGRAITGPDVGLDTVARLRSGVPVRVTIAHNGTEREVAVSLAP